MMNSFIMNNPRIFELNNIVLSLNERITRRTEEDDNEGRRATIRFIRQRSNLTNDSFEADDLYGNNNEDYLDFRNYPLNINWVEVNSSQSDSYEILETYGYIAVYVYNKLIANVHNFRCSPENFLQKLIETYFNCCKQSEEKNQSEHSKMIKIVFPSIQTLFDLITSEIIMKKEIVVINTLLHIYEHYYFKYEFYDSDIIINNLLPACLFFYSKLSTTDVDTINSKAKTIKISNQAIQNEVKKHIKKDQSGYIQYYLELTKKYKMLFEFTHKDSFVQ